METEQEKHPFSIDHSYDIFAGHRRLRQKFEQTGRAEIVHRDQCIGLSAGFIEDESTVSLTLRQIAQDHPDEKPTLKLVSTILDKGKIETHVFKLTPDEVHEDLMDIAAKEVANYSVIRSDEHGVLIYFRRRPQSNNPTHLPSAA